MSSSNLGRGAGDFLPARAAYINAVKIKSLEHLLAALRHNLRETKDVKHRDGTIDGRRSHMNVRLKGVSSSEKGRVEFNRLRELAEANQKRKPRKDAVVAIEVVVSWPYPELADPEDYFWLAFDWCFNFYDGCLILSAVVHRDEACPHLHYILIPFVKNWFRGSDLFGNRARLTQMQDSFYTGVAKRFGLARPRSSKGMNSTKRKNVTEQVLDVLKQNPSEMKLPDVGVCLRELINADPIRLANALRIDRDKDLDK